jgi:uncharacterized protein YjbI with pentapeptide repeats
MKKIEIKNRFTGDIMFTIISENATIKDALLDAIKNKVNLSRANLSRAYLSGADLSRADLSGAYLSGADLSGADLSGAYLSGADLSRANLSRAYLSGADLSRANLSRAYLSGADLSGADLSGADLSGADLSGADFQPFCKWRTSIKDNEITIGCKTKSIDDWDIFFNSDLLYETKRNTEEFKKIQAVFESYKTYINFLNK